MAKEVDQKDSELTSCYRHTIITTIYRATICEKVLKTSRKDFPHLKIQSWDHREADSEGQRCSTVKTHIDR